MRRTVALLCVLMLSSLAGFAADGIYAVMQTTMGEFQFELYYTNTPRTVANFINLAEGRKPWLDPRNGYVVAKPYYDGIIFHRVIKNFMIQCGSPKGTGTDGPGYRFNDEFDPALRHDQAGTVSMANSGTNSNGGQIFITTESTPWLDDHHTVFGRIVSGMDVVSNIAAVAVNDSRPVVDVVITNVIIARNDVAAQAFDPDAVTPALPVVRPATNNLYFAGGSYILDWKEHPDCLYWIFIASTLDNQDSWHDPVGRPVNWSASDVTNILTNNPKFFFNVTEVESHE